MSGRPLCSVIIRCCNEERHIGRLLAGILGQTLEDHEVLVVDSGSTDATLAIARRFPVRIVHIAPEEFSFGRSLNLGCEAARGEFLVFASAHVYPVHADWLERLLAPFEDPGVALVYGKQRGNEVTRYSEHQIFRTWFPEEANRKQEHPFCNNANAAVRRSLWASFPYDESLTGLEDLDWARRVLEQGHHLAYEPSADIIHVHEETLPRIYNRYRREAIAMKRIFPHQRFGLLDFFRLFAANTLSDAWHALHDGVLMRNLLDIPAFRLMQFLGTYRGYRRTRRPDPRLKRRFYYPAGFSRAGRAGRPEEERSVLDYSHLSGEESTNEAG